MAKVMAKQLPFTVSETDRHAAEEEIRRLQKEIGYDLRDFTINFIIQQFQDGEFYVPEYQRNFIWNEKTKSRFIESVILGLPIPMMFLADMEDGRWEIVDGAQRIQTLEQFVNNDLRLKELVSLHSLNGFSYADLPGAQQRKFGGKALRLVVLKDSTSMALRQEIFDRVNTSGVKAKASEVRRGAFKGPFMDFIIECAKDASFRSMCPISSQLRQRREDEELVLRFFAYSQSYKQFKHDVDVFLDRYAKAQHQFDRDTLAAEFRRMLAFIEKHFPYGFAKSPNSTATPRVRFEAIAVGVNLALRQKPNLSPPTPVSKWLESQEFLKHTTTHASNSAPRLKGRIEFVRDQLLR